MVIKNQRVAPLARYADWCVPKFVWRMKTNRTNAVG